MIFKFYLIDTPFLILWNALPQHQIPYNPLSNLMGTKRNIIWRHLHSLQWSWYQNHSFFFGCCAWAFLWLAHRLSAYRFFCSTVWNCRCCISLSKNFINIMTSDGRDVWENYRIVCSPVHHDVTKFIVILALFQDRFFKSFGAILLVFFLHASASLSGCKMCTFLQWSSMRLMWLVTCLWVWSVDVVRFAICLASCCAKVTLGMPLSLPR